MSFVEMFGSSDPAESDDGRLTRPEWSGPPDDVLGVAVPVHVVLARSALGAVGLSHGMAYSNGVSFEFVAHARGLTRMQANMLFHEQHKLDGEELPPGLLRLGIELPDGRRVSNLGGIHARHAAPAGGGEPDGPLLLPTSGDSGMTDGGGVVMRPGYWLWPLPERGTLRISCEWPLVEIPLTTTEIDASAFVDAAASSVDLWG